jgi:hypothetical protein
VTFLFQLNPPKKEGVYKEKLALMQGNRTIYFLTDKGFETDMPYTIRVDEAKKRVVVSKTTKSGSNNKKIQQVF